MRRLVLAIGAWNLVTINGSPLPFTIDPTANPVLEILSDQFVASSSGAFSDAITYRETNGTTVTTTTQNAVGTWSQSGSIMTVTETATGFVTTATISGNTATVSGGVSTAVYHRQ
jgi:hypothetical protein